MINIIENGINPILEKDKDNYPKLAVKIGINGENLAIQHEFDKSSLIDLIGYSMNVAAKITSMTRPNKYLLEIMYTNYCIPYYNQKLRRCI